MESKDKDLKDFYQLHIKEHAPSKKSCPDIVVLARSFSTETSENEKIKIIDHISSCGNCFKKFEMLRQILKGSKKLADQFEGLSLSEAEVKELKQRAQNRIHEFESHENQEEKVNPIQKFIATFKTKPALKYGTAIAGVFIVALAAFFVTKIPRTLQEGALRGEKLESILLISPKGELVETPTKFQWASVAGAKEYQVVLLDVELTRIWISENTESNVISIPSKVRNRLQKEKVFYWKVVLLLEDGTKKESDLQKLILTENP